MPDKLHESQEWLTNWLLSRKDIFKQNYDEAHPYKKYIPNASDRELAAQLRRMRSIKSYVGKEGFNQLKSLGIQDKVHREFKGMNSYEEAPLGFNAFLNSDYNLIFFRNNDRSNKSAAHEFTHGLHEKTAQDWRESPQDIKISKILKEDPFFIKRQQQIFGKYKSNDSRGNKIYKWTPDEVYARLNQLRHDFKFDPKHVWTEKEVHEQRKNWGRNNGSLYYFDKDISDKTLTRLLNEVALNNNQTEQDNTTYYAKYGGKLIRNNGKISS